MRRREFLATAGGVTTTAGLAAEGENAAAATPTTAENGSPTTTETANGSGSEGSETHTVDMTDTLVFEPESLTIAPGDTVVWENVGSIGHSVTAYEDNIPENAEYFASGGFDAEQPARDNYPAQGNILGGETYSHTFETEGTYEYFCIPHEDVGMIGTIEVSSAGQQAAGVEEVDPEEMGVPFRAHYIGIATFLGIGIALLFTFFFLKYGETPHSGYPEEK